MVEADSERAKGSVLTKVRRKLSLALIDEADVPIPARLTMAKPKRQTLADWLYGRKRTDSSPQIDTKPLLELRCAPFLDAEVTADSGGGHPSKTTATLLTLSPKTPCEETTVDLETSRAWIGSPPAARLA